MNGFVQFSPSHAAAMVADRQRHLMTLGRATPGRTGEAKLGPVRALLLALVVVGAGLAGVRAQPAHEAAAAGPCALYPSVQTGSYNGYRTLYAYGFVSCSYAGNQEMTVELKANGSVIARWHVGPYYRMYLEGWTGSFYCYSGVRYQAVLVHRFGGANSYATTGTPRTFC